MARPARKNPTTAIEKLLQEYGYNGSELVYMGYFKSLSSVYGAARRDVTSLTVRTLVAIGNGIKLSPGAVLDRLLQLQQQYPPKDKKTKK